MFHPKLRSVVTTTALVSALASIPAHALPAQSRPRTEPGHRVAAARTAPSALWSFLVDLFQKQSIRIDPNGQDAPTTTSTSESGSTLVPSGGK